MSALRAIQSVFQDPPPEYAFEISASGIAMSRTRPPATMQFAALAEGIVTPSVAHENISDAAAVTAAIRRLVPSPGTRRTAALILPDSAVRIAVIDFENIPEKEEDRLALIRFRVRKTVPFDVDHAAVSFAVQPGNRILAAIAPRDVVLQYESPFRAAGLQPGVVLPASIALMELLPVAGSYLVAFRDANALSVLAVANGSLTLARSLEWSAEGAGDIISDLYATRVYLEDQAGATPARIYLAGFGAEGADTAKRFAGELDLEASVLAEEHPALAGYLRALTGSGAKAA